VAENESIKFRTEYFHFLQSCQDFPKKGIVYWDFTPLLENPEAFRSAVSEIKNHFSDSNSNSDSNLKSHSDSSSRMNKIAAIESKGFILGSALSYEMKLPLALIRKPGLIPGDCCSEKFEKEYGFGEYQIKKSLFSKEDKVLLVYDILAGAGATKAAISLIEKSGAEVVGCAYIIELEYLDGRKDLPLLDIFSLVKIREKDLPRGKEVA
jgi:adenine phosphoribosyltransferase